MKRTTRGYVNEKSVLFAAGFFAFLVLSAVTKFFFGYSNYPVLQWLPTVFVVAALICLVLSYVTYKKSAGKRRSRRRR